MFVVQGVPLIAQDLDNACWFASAQMVIQWRRGATQSCEDGIIDPSEDADAMAIYAANNGLSDDQILTLANNLGLQPIPPMCPTIGAMKHWLHHYGPLWTNGSSHITVIGGVNAGNGKILVYDPWPVNVGKVEWRTMGWLAGVDGDADVDSLDPNTFAGVFLHCPA